MLLALKDVSVVYGTVAAVKDISMAVEEGRIVTLIGANGAGKTTTLRAVSGLHHPARGEIWFDGRRIDRLAPERITGLGVAHVPEGRRVFPQMSVLENLEMGAYLRRDPGAVKRDLDAVFHDFPVLRQRRSQSAGTLSGGEQQMLAIGRALMSDPRLLLLDEPSLGLSPLMCQRIARIIETIHGSGRTIVLVEQNARLALTLAQTGYVLETGRIVLEGPTAMLRENEQVKESYLGINGNRGRPADLTRLCAGAS